MHTDTYHKDQTAHSCAGTNQSACFGVQAVVDVRQMSCAQGLVVFVPAVSSRRNTQLVFAVQLHHRASCHSLRNLAGWRVRGH